MGQHPSLNEIDKEIRSLVYLLNQAPYIQTFASCSGHPSMPEREWKDGWITIDPVGNPDKLWDFLEALRARLDNTTATKMIQYYSEQQYLYRDKVFELYKRVGAEELFFFGNSHFDYELIFYSLSTLQKPRQSTVNLGKNPGYCAGIYPA